MKLVTFTPFGLHLLRTNEMLVKDFTQSGKRVGAQYRFWRKIDSKHLKRLDERLFEPRRQCGISHFQRPWEKFSWYDRGTMSMTFPPVRAPARQTSSYLPSPQVE